jgi:type IV secretion system protein VirD4
MTGKTTVVEEKVSLSGSRSGHLKNASVNVTETARPLLTPDECMRLPGIVSGPEKNRLGKALVKPGDMLIFTAGQSPIYGRQILYFVDPVFSARSKIPAPGLSDSLHAPRPRETPTATPAAPNPAQESYESYFAE